MYPDIFESATFSFRIQTFPRPHASGFVADLVFSTLKSELKNIRIRRIRRMRVGRKPYPETRTH